VTKYVVVGLVSFQFIAVALLAGVPSRVNAGILSMLTNLLGSQATAAEDEISTNSQKMPLLEAPLNTKIARTEAPQMQSTLDAIALVSKPMVSLSVETNEGETYTETHQITTYKVKAGDTISDIAEQFNISVNTILWANNLNKSSTISVGQNLVILPISGVRYRIAKGDTIQTVATKFKGDAKEILAFNNLDTETLVAGEEIVIPDGVMASKPVEPRTPAAPLIKAPKLANAVKNVLGISVAHAELDTSASPSGFYGRPILAGIRTQGIHGYNGVDLADVCGTPIYASAAGTVVIAKESGWNGGYGNYVVLSHDNNSQTLYAHMDQVIVSEGATITQGQALGTIGNTGKVHGVTGCHVHFEIRGGGRNPF
jgi:murein DD-endopeptidase MepM/ murein hydrolase activator NlpD